MAVASESYAPSVLVSTERLPEKDWLEYRRRGIGGSDAAAILGISPFATARDLYYDKLKIVPFDDSESNWVSWYSISIRVRTFWRAVSSPVGSFSKDGMILPLFPLEKMPVQHGNAHHLII